MNGLVLFILAVLIASTSFYCGRVSGVIEAATAIDKDYSCQKRD